MKRVLLITQDACGGAERMTLLYGKILEKGGADISLWIWSHPTWNESSLIPFVPTYWDTKRDVSRYRYKIYLMYRYIKEKSPDIIFVSLPYLSNDLLLLKKLHLIKSEVIIRWCNMPNRLSKKDNKLFKYLNSSASIIVAQTKEMKNEIVSFYSISENRITVINNPIDKKLIKDKIKEKSPLNKDTINFVAVGRCNSQKDYKTLINAFSIFYNQNYNSKLYIVGAENDHEYKRKLEEQIHLLNLESRVIFEGFQENPYKYINDSDAFILSSIFEGLPNVLLEAMFIGRPVVATNCIPFIEKVVNEGVNGYVCNVGDYKEMAKKMGLVLNISSLPKFKDITNSEKDILILFRLCL